MRTFFTVAAFAIAAMAGPAAQAFPVSPQSPLANSVIEVSGLCGLGWHRGRDGMCYRNGGPYGYGPYAGYVPTYVYDPAHCWWTQTVFGPRRVCAW
ncbi:hypothetical protein [Bradyrhizobium sp.]|uniref:hypothetical protein n=1 Tax=Bradyrhizobium sp. TaxID=376 RepID=UPI003C428ABF